MAERYRANGSAAYNLYGQTAARPLVQPKRLPDAPVIYPPAKKVKAKYSVAPLTVLGIAAVIVMCFLLIYSYASLFEAKAEADELRQEQAELLSERKDLLLRYESGIDMEQVERRATELGMALPGAHQIVYVDVAEANEAISSFSRFYDTVIAPLSGKGE